jgi:hypothetical protein
MGDARLNAIGRIAARFARTRAVPIARHVTALLALAGACATASCDRCGGADTNASSKNDASSDAAPSARPSSSANGPPPEVATDASPPIRDAATAAFDAAIPDAGPSACRLAYGPAEQVFRGPAAIVPTATELKLVANDGGKPRVFAVPLGPPPPASAPAVAPSSPSSFVAMRWPPCEMAGRWAYCQAAGGVVYRTTLGTTDTKQIAKSQPSTRIAAASLGPEHSVLATLDARRTSEGVMMQAFVTLDDGETTRLSDDGAGATVLRVVARGDRAFALYLDARTAMLPVHARPLSLRGKDLVLGDDAVVFVGGPPERGIELTAAAAGRSLFALVPMARETTDFGMAAIPIADQPKDDVQPAWSLYPNGLDPAPIAATVPSVAAGDGMGAGAAWVARVRPSERTAGSPRILELGRLDSAGAFTSLGAISTGKRITDIAIATDSFGAVWILYGDTNATWLERRVCP